MRKVKLIFMILFVTGLPGFSEVASAGDLQPPAAPNSTMKTLDEVEPRIPITQDDIPLTINQSGSYYLTEDVTAAGTAVVVAADDVTIDLMGYTIEGPDSGSNYGILMTSRDNVEIRNGTIRDFTYGIRESSLWGRNHRIINVRVASNLKTGVDLDGSNNLIKDCTARENGNSATGTVYGISTGENSMITGCTVNNNGISAGGYVYGIDASKNSVITGCTINNNGDSAAGNVYGIYAYESSMVTGCIVNNNGDSATGGSVYGIYAYKGSIVKDNVTSYNGGTASGGVRGIFASYSSTVTGNVSYANGNQSTGSSVYGIYVYRGSTLTGNTSYNNGNSATGTVRGLYAAPGSTVIGNTAYGNGFGASGTVHGIYLEGNALVDQNTAYGNHGTNMNSPASCTFGMNHAP